MVIKKIIAVLLLASISSLVKSQEITLGNFSLETKRSKAVKMDINVYNNLIVIPVIINNSRDTLKLVLDTGVAKTLITGLPNNEEINLNFTRKIKVDGLGEGESIDAFYSVGNNVIIDQTTGNQQEVLVLEKDIFNLSNLLGTYVHGLIGHSIFKDFIVEIDYNRRWIKFHDYDRFNSTYKKKASGSKWSLVPLKINDGKPYIEAQILQENGSRIPVSLLIDTGSSKSLALYHSAKEDIILPEKRIRSFLGNGLSGEINGYLGLIEELQIGDFTFNKLVATYPDEEGIKKALLYSSRDGSIGSEVMKRFKIMFNYRDSTMILQPSPYFNDPFGYNSSGIEIATPFPNIKVYQITHVREGSVAEESGILEGDFITEINGKSSASYTLNEALNIFTRSPDDLLRLKIVRNDSSFRKQLNLSNILD
jgi:hypothetical protein